MAVYADQALEHEEPSGQLAASGQVGMAVYADQALERRGVNILNKLVVGVGMAVYADQALELTKASAKALASR